MRTIFMPLAVALVLSAVTLPARAGDVAMETLKIQNEGLAKDSKKRGPTASHEATHTDQQGAAQFIPEKDDQVIVGFERGELKKNVKPDQHSNQPKGGPAR